MYNRGMTDYNARWHHIINISRMKHRNGNESCIAVVIPDMTTNDDNASVNDQIRQIRDEFGGNVYGVKTVADFMVRHGALAAAPQSLKDVAVPSLANTPSN